MANKKQKKIIKIDNVEEIIKEVMKYKRVKITNFGFFILRKYAGKKNKVKEFASKEARIPSHNRLVFKPLKNIKDIINR